MTREPSNEQFEIEPLEERVAPSAMSWGYGGPGGDGQDNQVQFIGYDPPGSPPGSGAMPP